MIFNCKLLNKVVLFIDMLKTKIIFIILITSSLYFTGCKILEVNEGAAPGVRVNEPGEPQAGIRFNTVNIIDKSLQENKKGKIAIESTNSSRTPTGTLEVWVLIRNRTDFPLELEGRTQFFDEFEVPVEGPTKWNRIFLPPNSVTTYKAISTSTVEIKYYYVEIREGR